MRKAFCLLSIAIVGFGALATSAIADDLKVGDLAPDFSLPGTDGKTHALKDLKGQWVVLAWFPKAFTGG